MIEIISHTQTHTRTKWATLERVAVDVDDYDDGQHICSYIFVSQKKYCFKNCLYGIFVCFVERKKFYDANWDTQRDAFEIISSASSSSTWMTTIKWNEKNTQVALKKKIKLSCATTIVRNAILNDNKIKQIIPKCGSKI